MNDNVMTGIFFAVMISLAVFSFVDTAITGDVPCFVDENNYCR